MAPARGRRQPAAQPVARTCAKPSVELRKWKTSYTEKGPEGGLWAAALTGLAWVDNEVHETWTWHPPSSPAAQPALAPSPTRIPWRKVSDTKTPRAGNGSRTGASEGNSKGKGKGKGQTKGRKGSRTGTIKRISRKDKDTGKGGKGPARSDSGGGSRRATGNGSRTGGRNRRKGTSSGR